MGAVFFWVMVWSLAEAGVPSELSRSRRGVGPSRPPSSVPTLLQGNTCRARSLLCPETKLACGYGHQGTLSAVLLADPLLPVWDSVFLTLDLYTPPTLAALLNSSPGPAAPRNCLRGCPQRQRWNALGFPGAVHSDEALWVSCPEKDKYF